MVRVAEVAEHPKNPRDTLGDLSELAASIKQLGVRQPITVIPAATFKVAYPDLELPAGARWVPMDGHRRRAASSLAEVDEIPAWIRSDLSDAADGPETFLAANIHRMPLSPLEEARAMALLSDLGRSQRQIAQRTGFSQSHVSKRLSLLSLPQQVQDALTREELTVGDALVIASVPAADQLTVFERAREARVPVATAVAGLDRERADLAKLDKARRRADREGVPFIERPHEEFRRPWEHRLESKADVAEAKGAGTLVAAAEPGGSLVYYTTEAQASDGSDDEAARKAARVARTAAAAQLVQRKPPARELADELADALLYGRVPHADALRLVHKWLGRQVGDWNSDMYVWRNQVAAAGAASRAWVAWAMTIAGAELRVRAMNRAWDVTDTAYLDQLRTKVSYEPTEWESAQLALAARHSDSDGITAAGEES